MGIGSRLREARIHAGFASARSAALAFGWPPSTYASHENGQTDTPPIEVLTKYAKAFRVPVEHIAFGGGFASPAPAFPAASQPATISVTLVSWVSAGGFTERDGVTSSDALDTLRIADIKPGQWIALRVEGDSMDRISPPESVILVDMADRKLVPNACYVIASEDGSATYKRYRPSPDRFEPVSVNAEHEPIFPNGAIRVIGRVRRTMLDM